ncbi:aminotransferase class IV family protein [Albirhodobacter sp. R86504]|uniref:aminotransferase class IV family protein n=1 Tax=Albirhodobacter sp. R86504 TaxID=3093848 RepID=UPI00366E4661
MESTVPENLKIIETFGWHPIGGVARLSLHRARLARTAKDLGFAFDGADFDTALSTLNGDSPLRIRLTVEASGKIEMTTAPLTPSGTWRVALSPVRLASDDPFLPIKTTQRAPYEAARARMPLGVDEVILLNERDEVCEGTITNLFLLRDGHYLTPAASSGLLLGVLRESMLATGKAREALLTPADLREGALFMGNSLRGLIPALLEH